MINQQEIIKDCLRGKLLAQKQLYAHFANDMMGICYRYTKSIADAEDVLQEAFIKVFTKLKDYRSDGELGAWIRRIVINTVLNHLKRNRFIYSEIGDEHDNVDNHIDWDAEKYITGKELIEIIRKLPSNYNLIFNLHAIEGYSFEEIREMTGIKSSTCRSTFLRARMMLKEEITNNESKSYKTNQL